MFFSSIICYSNLNFLGIDSNLFASQRLHRLHCGGAVGWQPAGQQSHSQQDECDNGNGSKINGSDAVESAGHGTTHEKCADQSNAETGKRESHSFLENQFHNIVAAGSEG